MSIFGQYGIDVSHEFAPVREAFNAAMYVSDDEGANSGGTES